MAMYTSTDARQKLEQLLEEAKDRQEVMITNANGDVFLLRLLTRRSVRERVPHVQIGLTREEIMDYIREIRER